MEEGPWRDSPTTPSNFSSPPPPNPSPLSSMARRAASKCGTTTTTPTPRKRSAPKPSASMRSSKRRAVSRESVQSTESPPSPSHVEPLLPWPKWKRRPPGASRLLRGRPKALSEPPPDTAATTDLPYLAVHTVVTPFGQIAGSRTTQIVRREIMARAGEWIPAQQRWRKELDAARGGPRT